MSDAMRRAPSVTPTGSVVLERTYRATVEELWALWTTADGFESWWPPAGTRTVVRSIDARIDGELVYEMIAESPDVLAVMQQLGMPPSHIERARFTEFQPYQRLVLRPMMDFLPGVAPYESTLVVDILASGEWATMRVTLLPMHDAAFMVLARQGLESQFRNVDALFLGRGRSLSTSATTRA